MDADEFFEDLNQRDFQYLLGYIIHQNINDFLVFSFNQREQ